jgi:antirestriction protein
MEVMMNEPKQEEMQPQEFEQQPGSSERGRTGLAPRIYVASLSDYNAGTLHGEWIDADQEPDAIYAEIRAMLAGSEEANAEEFAVHDYEDFGSMRIGEYESIPRIAKIASGIAEHGAALGHWAEHCQQEFGHCAGPTGESEWSEALGRFDEAYQGVWESEEAYAESVLNDWGLPEMLDSALPEGLRPYVDVDYKAFAADLFTELLAVRDEAGVHLFQP